MVGRGAVAAKGLLGGQAGAPRGAIALRAQVKGHGQLASTLPAIYSAFTPVSSKQGQGVLAVKERKHPTVQHPRS